MVSLPQVPLDPRDGEPSAANVVSVGVDLVQVSDIRDSVARFGDRYLRRLFTDRELADCSSGGDPIPRLAARYAAKEATVKALRVLDAIPRWTSMEVKRSQAGWCDEMSLHGSAAELAAARGIGHLLVSLSHEQDAAVAVVVATRAASRDAKPAERNRRRPSPDGRSRRLRIAFFNNMPDAAFHETHRQFTELFDGSPGSKTIRCFAIRSVPRDAALLRTADVVYEDHSELYRNRPDLLVVTGAEPRQEDLAAEPYWDDLSEMLAWAAGTVPVTVLSCLAAHAAALALHGIRRRPLPAKRFGVYPQAVDRDNRITAGLTEPVLIPHSRLNGIAASSLADHGYQVALSSSDGAGSPEWSVATKETEGRLLVLVQGHPEYSPTTLLREYRRDVRRFLEGESPRYPEIPDNYLDGEGRSLLSGFEAQCLAGEHTANSADRFPFEKAAAHITPRWDRAAAQLVANCLSRARAATALTTI